MTSLTVGCGVSIEMGQRGVLNPRVAIISFNAPPISSIVSRSPVRIVAACREVRASSTSAGAGLARNLLMSALAPVMAGLIEVLFDS